MDISDFGNSETLRVLEKKATPAIRKAAEMEFGAIISLSDIDSDDIWEMLKQAELIKAFLCSYVDGLAAQYCVHGAEFYGDQSAKAALYAKFCRDRDQFRD